MNGPKRSLSGTKMVHYVPEWVHAHTNGAKLVQNGTIQKHGPELGQNWTPENGTKMEQGVYEMPLLERKQ